MDTTWLLIALVIAGIWMSTLQRRIERLESELESLARASRCEPR